MTRDWRGRLNRYGVAVGYATALAAGSLALALQPEPTRQHWREWASTNVVNLRDHPVSAMAISGLYASSSRAAWLALALLGIGATGRVLGAWRTALVVGAAHVLGTLISQGILWYRITIGAVPASQERILDIGPSYVVLGGLVAGMLLSTWRVRLLCLGGFLLVAPTSFLGLPHLELSAMGHTSASLVALGLAWLLGRGRRTATAPVPATQPNPA